MSENFGQTFDQLGYGVGAVVQCVAAVSPGFTVDHEYVVFSNDPDQLTANVLDFFDLPDDSLTWRVIDDDGDPSTGVGAEWKLLRYEYADGDGTFDYATEGELIKDDKGYTWTHNGIYLWQMHYDHTGTYRGQSQDDVIDGGVLFLSGLTPNGVAVESLTAEQMTTADADAAERGGVLPVGNDRSTGQDYPDDEPETRQPIGWAGEDDYMDYQMG